ncbi:MAG TPA: hypothetical protein VGM53_36280 [Streptosporangiaceae bacterium]|jgi:hypothetical protein
MTAAERVVDLYRRHAGAWAAARGAKLAERAWIERFAAMLGLAGAQKPLNDVLPRKRVVSMTDRTMSEY